MSGTAVRLTPHIETRQAEGRPGRIPGRAAALSAAALGRHVDADDEDVLRYVIWWVKENRGDGPHLVAEVASILSMLGLPAAEAPDT